MKTMKINAHNLPAAPQPSASSRSGSDLSPTKRAAGAVKESLSTAGPAFSSRPVRISRFPEEAALFAYGRNATLPPPAQPSQIDEYV